jgi:hypothetical protein
MSFEYSAENHDWDLTLRAAWNLLMSGQAVKAGPDFERKNEQEFSFLTGSMLLSFCAIESFTSSIAFSISENEKFETFDYEEYRKTARFWDKIEKVCKALGSDVDKSQGLFQSIKKMQIWRNALAHSSPYENEKTIIQDTQKEPKKLHKPFQDDEYAKAVNVESAKQFYSTAFDYIDLIKKKSGLDPRATCSYKALG